MAGDWIQMRHDLPDDPAVIGIAERTKLDEDAVIGKLHRVWTWADRQTLDGNAPSVTLAWLDRYVKCDGFGAAMCAVGWLEQSGDGPGAGLRIPKFDEYISESAKKRALTARRAKKLRSKRNADRNAERNAGSVTDSVTKSAPKEEKRREENNTPIAPKGASASASSCACFERWWNAYPKSRRSGREATLKSYQRAGKRLVAKGKSKAEAVAFLQERVEAFSRSPKGQSQYVPNPAVWLNQGRYDDDPAAWQRGDDDGDRSGNHDFLPPFLED